MMGRDWTELNENQSWIISMPISIRIYTSKNERPKLGNITLLLLAYHPRIQGQRSWVTIASVGHIRKSWFPRQIMAYLWTKRTPCEKIVFTIGIKARWGEWHFWDCPSPFAVEIRVEIKKSVKPDSESYFKPSMISDNSREIFLTPFRFIFDKPCAWFRFYWTHVRIPGISNLASS